MSKTVKIKRGLDIKLKGKAELRVEHAIQPKTVAIMPSDFQGIVPKLSVKADDHVAVGTSLFSDKKHPEIMVVSPVSGKVVEVNRGERRKILELVIEPDGKDTTEPFPADLLSIKDRETARRLMLQSGLWPFLIQRPFGIVANPNDTPRDIFISGFDSAPLAPDYDFLLKGEKAAFQHGVDLLRKLTAGKVYLGLKHGSLFSDLKNAEINYFEGPPPAGNVGIQLHHIKPINKGEVVWTIQPQAVVFIGRLLMTGKLDFSKTVALTGSEVNQPLYLKTVAGACIESIVGGRTRKAVTERIISGNVLTGNRTPEDGYLGYYHNQQTVIPEGNNIEPLGWASPGFDKYSPTKTFLSKLFPRKEYVLNANFHGGERAFVVSEQYEKVLPMDILPVYLLKAIIVNDFDKMEQLGIYEVIEEDFALCEYVCTSKIEVQDLLRKGMNTVIKETV
jgi:Na+-transporting NADH:ubiquinone oxidoreductase subunit A